MDEMPTRIAAWQCRPGPLDVSGNLRRLAGACAVAAARGVDVLVTPEMFTTGYAITAGEVLRLAEEAGGPTETELNLAHRERLAHVLAAVPSGRMSTLDEIGAAVVFLADDATPNLHGATLSIDGAFSAV